MKRELLRDIDWKKHLPGLTLFSIALLFFIGSCFLYWDEKSTLLQIKSAFQQKQYENSSAEIAKSVIENSLAQYRALSDQGVVGVAARLQWLETLKSLSSTFEIPLMEYTLEQTATATSEDSLYWHSEIAFTTTAMTLDINMRHEADLFRLLNGLAGQAPGLFSVENCDLRRNSAGADEDPELVGIKANCRLQWYILNDVTAGWEASDDEIH